MVSRHGRPDNPDGAPDAALDPVRWPDGRWTTTPPADGPRWTTTEMDGPRPSADFDPGPDARDEAYHLGFRLGADGETPVTPPDLDLDGAVAFVAGVLDGVRELDRRVDAMFADRADDGPREYHPDEMIRALGCVAARTV